MIGLVFIPHPSEAIDKKDTDLSPSQVKDYSSHAKQLSSSCGLSQSEINRLFIHFGKLDLSAALPALKNVSAELGHIENHAINGQMTEKERQQWVAKINDGLELLQLKADFYMKTDDGTKPLSLNTLVSKQTLEDGFGMAVGRGATAIPLACRPYQFRLNPHRFSDSLIDSPETGLA